MGYKKYSDIYMAQEMVNKIERGEIPNRDTAYRELLTVVGEWRGTSVADEAEDLIDTRYSDLKFDKNKMIR